MLKSGYILVVAVFNLLLFVGFNTVETLKNKTITLEKTVANSKVTSSTPAPQSLPT